MGRISKAISDTSRTLLGKNVSRAIFGGAVKNINASADAYASPNPIPGFKKGGRVKKTGIALVHKGEFVLTASQAKTLKKLLNK